MKKGYSLLLVGLIFFSFFYMNTNSTDSVGPFFTLVFKTNGGGVRPDYGYLLRDQLARIGIHLEVIIQDWPTFVGELIAFRDFDICYVDLLIGGASLDYNGMFSDYYSPLNIFGYDTSMDWDEELGTGKNEWYIREGTQIMPPNSQERIQHYWAWEDYLMDKILPLQPTFNTKSYKAYWRTLKGYNYSEGLLQSWGKMSWDGHHTGQEHRNEIVITDYSWDDLNPFFYIDSASDFVVKTCYDPLIWYDADLTVWPHLAESFTMLNDTLVRITARQGIKWQNDSGSLFTDEYFDIYDVYFTLYCWKEVSNDKHIWDWIDDMEIIDQWTMDIHIDGDTGTPEREVYAPFLDSLCTLILPEHYLNQTQLPDGKTPDIMHSSWDSLATECIGTGLFTLSNYTEHRESNLKINSESWWINETITSDPNLNWEARFGDFSGGLDYLRIRIIPDEQTVQNEFEAGKIDLVSLTSLPKMREDTFCCQIDFSIQSDLTFVMGYFGYNMREVRPVIGSRSPATCDPSLTVGLCLRKAISYAMDREEMNNIIHSGEYEIVNHPIYKKLGIWCNPDIIIYNHDINEAQRYMAKVGCDRTPTIDISLISVIGGIFILLTTTIWYIKTKNRKENFKNNEKM